MHNTLQLHTYMHSNTVSNMREIILNKYAQGVIKYEHSCFYNKIMYSKSICLSWFAPLSPSLFLILSLYLSLSLPLFIYPPLPPPPPLSLSLSFSLSPLCLFLPPLSPTYLRLKHEKEYTGMLMIDFPFCWNYTTGTSLLKAERNCLQLCFLFV